MPIVACPPPALVQGPGRRRRPRPRSDLGRDCGTRSWPASRCLRARPGVRRRRSRASRPEAEGGRDGPRFRSRARPPTNVPPAVVAPQRVGASGQAQRGRRRRPPRGNRWARAARGPGVELHVGARRRDRGPRPPSASKKAAAVLQPSPARPAASVASSKRPPPSPR